MLLSIQRRIQLSLAGAFTLVALVGLVTVVQIGDLADTVHEVGAPESNLVWQAKDLRSGVLSVGSLMKQLEAKPEELGLRDALNAVASKLRGDLERSRALAKSEGTRSALAGVAARLDELDGLRRRWLAGEAPAAPAVSLAARIHSILDEFSGSLETLEQAEVQAFEERRTRAVSSAGRARQRVLVTVGLALIGMIALTSLGTPRVVIPLQRILAAIKLAEELQFDRTIQLRGSAELKAIGDALNRMVDQVKKFDSLKTRRIRLEMRRFDAFARLVDKAVLVCKADGVILSANDTFYSTVGLTSVDILNKQLRDTALGPEMTEVLSGSLTERSRLTREPLFFQKPSQEDVEEKTLLVSSAMVMDDREELAYGVFLFEEKLRPPAPAPAPVEKKSEESPG